MKIKIEQSSAYSETEIIVRCSEIDEEVEKLISTVRLFANTVIGKKDSRTFILKPEDIFAFRNNFSLALSRFLQKKALCSCDCWWPRQCDNKPSVSQCRRKG